MRYFAEEAAGDAGTGADAVVAEEGQRWGVIVLYFSLNTR
jgi:hypothetical protein